MYLSMSKYFFNTAFSYLSGNLKFYIGFIGNWAILTQIQ